MALAVRRLSEDEYREIGHQIEAAQNQINCRELEVSRTFDAIESQMVLLGATGIEDQLQEGVQETLESLKAAGIKVLLLFFFLLCQEFIYSHPIFLTSSRNQT